MNLETLSVYAGMCGVAVIFMSGAASIGSALTQADLSHFTSILNTLGFGLMSFGAGGILYTTFYGS
jgi:hypothetical protein